VVFVKPEPSVIATSGRLAIRLRLGTAAALPRVRPTVALPSGIGSMAPYRTSTTPLARKAIWKVACRDVLPKYDRLFQVTARTPGPSYRYTRPPVGGYRSSKNGAARM